MITTRNAFAVGCLCAALLAATAPAATIYWDPLDNNSGGGGGTMNGSNPVWDSTGYGGAQVAGAWADDWVFGGSVGSSAVTIDTNGAVRVAGSMTFLSNGYTVGVTFTASNFLSSSGPIKVADTTSVTFSGRLLGNTTFGQASSTYGGTFVYSNVTPMGNSGSVVTINSGTLRVDSAINANGNAATGVTINTGGTFLANNTTGSAISNSGGLSAMTIAGGNYYLNAKKQGGLNIDAVTPAWETLTGNINVRNITITTGNLYGGTVGGGATSGNGGVFVTGSHVSSNDTYGKFTQSGGTVDLQGASFYVLANNTDAFHFTMTGGTFATQAGKLIFGAINGQTTPQVINIALSGYDQTNANITGKLDLTNVYSAASTTRTFTVSDSSGNANPDFNISAVIGQVDGSHIGGLTKAGAGTLLLSGTNTYTGTTTVSVGTLKLSGTLATSKIIVNSAMTGGSGTIKFTPGDIIDVNGTMDMGGIFFDLSGLNGGVPVAGTTLVDFSGSGSISNFGSLTWTNGWNVTDAGTSLVTAVIPEPAALTLLAMAAAGLAARRQRGYFPRRSSL